MTIFSRIIAGEIPCYKVAEDDRFFAFLDINPVNWGHTLVVPKRETDSKKVAKAMKEAITCRKIGMAVLGLEVPHAHIHLVPLKNEGDMDFAHKISDPDPEKMKQIAKAISDKFEA